MTTQWSSSGLFFLYRNLDNLISLYYFNSFETKSIRQLIYSHNLPDIDNEFIKSKMYSYYPGYEINNLRYLATVLVNSFCFYFCHFFTFVSLLNIFFWHSKYFKRGDFRQYRCATRGWRAYYWSRCGIYCFDQNDNGTIVVHST